MYRELEIKSAPSMVQNCILRRQVQIPDWLYEEVGEKLMEEIGVKPNF